MTTPYILPIESLVALNDTFPEERRYVGRVVSHAIVGSDVHYIIEVLPYEMEKANLTSYLQIAHFDSVICVG